MNTAIVYKRKNPTAVNTCWNGKKSAGKIAIKIINAEDPIPTIEHVQLNPITSFLFLNFDITFIQNGMNEIPAVVIAITNMAKAIGLKIFGTERVNTKPKSLKWLVQNEYPAG